MDGMQGRASQAEIQRKDSTDGQECRTEPHRQMSLTQEAAEPQSPHSVGQDYVLQM